MILERSGYGFLYYDSAAEACWDAIKRAREIFMTLRPG